MTATIAEFRPRILAERMFEKSRSPCVGAWHAASPIANISSEELTMLTELQKRKLMKLFSMYDAKNLGVLKLSDFEQLAQRLADLRGWKADTPAYEEALNRYVLLQWNRIRAFIQHKLNRLPSNHISLEDWLAYYDIILNDEAYQAGQCKVIDAHQ